MDKKRLEEIKVMIDNARKNLAEKLKSKREELERAKRTQLVMDALDDLLKENADFRKQFESKLKELSLKEEAEKQSKP
jgi:molecular chaperone DnaK (HSP70)